MPTVEADTVTHVENSLKAYLKGGSQSGDLSETISCSVKKVLLEPVEFTHAQKPAALHVENLRNKYISLNPGAHGAGATNGHNSTGEGEASSNGVRGGGNHAQDDLPEPKIVLCPPSKVQLNWTAARRIGPGIQNLGNTCFLNSVLQCLTYTAPFANYVLSKEHKAQCRQGQVGFCACCEIGNHIERALTGPGHVMRPMKILSSLRHIARDMSWGKQEDSHEFLRLLLDHIQKSCYKGITGLDNLSKETTIVNQIFGGFLRSQVLCLRCRHRSSIYEPFLDLSLDIKNVTDIQKALERFVHPDQLEGKNAYKCAQCKNAVQAQKRFSIHRPPNVLTLQLKRFQFGGSIFSGSGKMTKHVGFPPRLNLRPYMSANKGEPVWYQLYGVICHSGYSCNSGHYFAYVNAPNRMWHVMNDAHVSPCNLNRVMSAEAYMLFYLKTSRATPVHNNNKTPTSNSAAIGNKTQNVTKNPLGSPTAGRVMANSLKSPKNIAQETVMSPIAGAHGSRILPANQRERISFGMKLPNQQQAQSKSAEQSKPRIVMRIISGKVVSPQKQPVKDKHTTPQSKLVPYGPVSDDEEDVGTRVQLNGTKDAESSSDNKNMKHNDMITGRTKPSKAESRGLEDDTRKQNELDSVQTDNSVSSSPKKRGTMRRSLSMDGMLSVNSNTHRQHKPNAASASSATDSHHDDWMIFSPKKNTGAARSTSVPRSVQTGSSTATKLSSDNRETPEKLIENTQSKIDKKSKENLETQKGIKQLTDLPRTPNAKKVQRFSSSKIHAPESGSNFTSGKDNGQDEDVCAPAKTDKEKLRIGRDGDSQDVNKSTKEENLMSPSHESEGDLEDSVSSKKRRKKKKKKKHKKHKKHEDREKLLESSDSEDSTSPGHSKRGLERVSSDFVWVEKTKETLETQAEPKRAKYDKDFLQTVSRDRPQGHKGEFSKLKERNSDPWTCLDSPPKREKQARDRTYSNQWDRSSSARMDSGDRERGQWSGRNRGQQNEARTQERRQSNPWNTLNSANCDSREKDTWSKPSYNRHSSWSGAGSTRLAWDGTRGNQDVVKELRGMAGAHGFGDRVLAWDGGRSAVDTAVERDRALERKRRLEEYDPYEDELDQGRVKKVKRKFEQTSDNRENPFQRFLDERTHGRSDNWASQDVEHTKYSHGSRGRDYSGGDRSHYGSGSRYNIHGDRFNNRGGWRGKPRYNSYDGGGYKPHHNRKYRDY